MGGQTIPAGTYSLFSIPEENGGKLIINKQTGQSGTKYDEKQDLVRVDLKKEALSPRGAINLRWRLRKTVTAAY